MNLLRSYEKRRLKLRSWLFDPENLTLDEATLGLRTRLNPSRTLATDRLHEIMTFYQVSEAEARYTQSDESMEQYKKAFDSGVETDKKLLDNYRACTFLSTSRYMLAYTRFDPASKILKHINSLYPPKQRKTLRVLDYGCGVSDYGLAFASFGYSVTIADIKGGNLEFSKWRYTQRENPVTVIPIQEECLYPDLGKQDIIVTGEVLEHVRNPLRVLQNMHTSLPKGGLLWYSGFPNNERNVGGCHLKEAADARKAACDFIKTHFKKATRLYLPGHLYQKL